MKEVEKEILLRNVQAAAKQEAQSARANNEAPEDVPSMDNSQLLLAKLCKSAGFSKISEAGRAPQANVPAPEIDTWPSRPRCQRCGRRPGRRIQCPICGYLVGPGCCWVHAQNRCRFCIHPEQPEPEPDVAKTKFSQTSASGDRMKAMVQVPSSVSLKRLPVTFVSREGASVERRRAVTTLLLLAMTPSVDAAQSKDLATTTTTEVANHLTLSLSMNFTTQMSNILIAAYLIIMHGLAFATCIRGWNKLRTDSAPMPSSPPATEEFDGIDKLLNKFKVDELRELMKVRGLKAGGPKSQLVARFRENGSRPTDKQLLYMYALMQSNHHLKITVKDVDSVRAASEWIDNAKQK